MSGFIEVAKLDFYVLMGTIIFFQVVLLCIAYQLLKARQEIIRLRKGKGSPPDTMT